MSGSLFHRTYYTVKPLLPKPVRYAFRSAVVQWKRTRVSDVWPVMPGSGRPPEAWPGWPEGKRFAVVLTHDVEGDRGLRQCRELAQLELDYGFRSSFNFVPEGEYKVPSELRSWLTGNGFEVGVHDHKHDGTLYRSQGGFAKSATVINRYLREWNAVGFRSGFMFHNLEWIQNLDVLYDASTFDTDPFEPQPTGVGTVFPFWVSRSLRGKGYAELPYTLAQDSTLFFFLRERTIQHWKDKLNWIAKAGGMALLNVHPDYIQFDESEKAAEGQYRVSLYRELLEFIRSAYQGQYWQVLPREVAEFVSRHREILPPPKAVSASLHRPKTPEGKIWIDLDNTPHVPFFKPIVRELERRGHNVLLTARDAFQVWQLVQKEKMICRRVGRHYGKNRVKKLAGLVLRSAQLVPFILRHRPTMALSLGARSQMLLANALGITTVEINDYEHATWAPLARPDWLLASDAIQAKSFGSMSDRVRHYSGLKEDVYAPDFRPNAAICSELGFKENDIVVTVRPPATEAHYHNPESEQLFVRLMLRLCKLDRVKAVLLPRNRTQEEAIRTRWPDWFANERTIVPQRAVDGLNLIWFSDLVVSGGGTMNREAAALGVPVYSIFRGKTGAVDQRLAEEGRLIMIQNEEEVASRILIQPRDKTWKPSVVTHPAMLQIVDFIESILRAEAPQQG